MNTKKRFRQVLLGALLMGLVLAGSFPHMALAAPAAAGDQDESKPRQQCLDRHGVKPGDSLLNLETLYGISWRKIAEANDIEYPWTIYVGQVLCIPGRKGVDPLPGLKDREEDEQPPLNFDVRVAGNTLTVITDRFPVNQRYFVRASDQLPAGAHRVKLGQLRTGARPGFVEATFILPKKLANAASLEVCLKNIVTDTVACTLWNRVVGES